MLDMITPLSINLFLNKMVISRIFEFYFIFCDFIVLLQNLILCLPLVMTFAFFVVLL